MTLLKQRQLEALKALRETALQMPNEAWVRAADFAWRAVDFTVTVDLAEGPDRTVIQGVIHLPFGP